MPLCVYNNESGEDAKVLASFSEASWNNPVVRIVGPDRKDVVKRNGDQWSVAAVAQQMIGALEARKRPVPTWLAHLASEARARRRGVEPAVFGMS